jgi:S1-C subfamily serine protease
MGDVHGGNPFAGTAPKIAIGAAAAALLTSLIAVIVVVSRGEPAPASGSAARAGAGTASSAAADEAPPPPPARRVAATDLVKLRREAVALVREAGKVLGVKVTDEDLRRALELEPGDVIAAISGRTIEREFDVFDITYHLKRIRASTVYVDLLRDRKPVLLRWKIDGDLQTARAPGPYDPGGALGSLRGGLGGNPYVVSAPDPLVDTVKRIDDLNYIVPRTTAERVFASTSAYAGVARTWPSRRTGGFQVFGVRPGTIVSAIGIVNGDSIRAINGHVVRSIDEAVELYQQIKDEREWRIDLERRGRPALITITFN